MVGTLAILEDRGIFWWNDEPVSAAQFAPDAAVSGKLTIEDDGSVRLELDDVMPSDRHPFDNLLAKGRPTEQNMQGLLTESGYVLLLNVFRNGVTMRTHNVSQERYFARQCLVSDQRFKRDGKAPIKFRTVEVDLSGFKDWLWLRSIHVKRQRNKLVADYKAQNNRRFTLSFGTISIEYNLIGPHFGKSWHNEIKMIESVSVVITTRKAMSISNAQDYYQNLQDLLILLTSSNHNVDWPTLTLWGNKHRAKLYFSRYRSDEEPPAAYDCLINFPRIAASFGDLFEAFIEKRERYGPGIYLYLGTRRGLNMFVEHRFVNLIWGLEALDRHGRGTVQPAAALDAKISRILSAAAPKDRHWLQGKLKDAAEPNLSERLYSTFSLLRLPFDQDALKRFCVECQARRNDISHFGGLRRKDQSYGDFIQDLDRKSDALSALYHLYLLTIIGVEEENIDFEKNNNRPLWRMASDLRAAGLLVPERDAKPT